MNIFIAEDNLQDYLYLRKIIEKWSKERKIGVKIYFRSQLYYQIPAVMKLCDLAFIDIHMPVVNGIEFVRFLRKSNEKIDIIFLSQNGSYGIEIYRLQALDYLLKPVKEKDIRRLLDKVLLKDQGKCLIYKQRNVLKKVKFEDILYLSMYHSNLKI